MQSFLNVITLQTYTFFTTLTPRLHGRSKGFFRRPQNLNPRRMFIVSFFCFLFHSFLRISLLSLPFIIRCTFFVFALICSSAVLISSFPWLYNFSYEFRCSIKVKSFDHGMLSDPRNCLPSVNVQQNQGGPQLMRLYYQIPVEQQPELLDIVLEISSIMFRSQSGKVSTCRVLCRELA